MPASYRKKFRPPSRESSACCGEKMPTLALSNANLNFQFYHFSHLCPSVKSVVKLPVSAFRFGFPRHAAH